MTRPSKQLLITFIFLNLVLVGLVLAWQYFLIKPTRELSDEIISARTELEAIKRQQNSVATWQELFTSKFQDSELLFEHSFTEDSVVNFVTSLEKIASDYGVKQTILFKDPPKKKKKKKKKKDAPEKSNKIYFDLILEAEFANLAGYLNAYENLNSYPEIVSLQIDVQEKKDPDNPNGTILLKTLRARLSGKVKHR